MKTKKILFILMLILLLFLLIFLSYNLILEIKFQNYVRTSTEALIIKEHDFEDNLNIRNNKYSISEKNINNNINKYVALGDSITLGTGLTNVSDESYASLLSNTFKTDVSNYGVDGMNSSWLLYNIEHGNDYKEDIKSADLITLSVGSNDILWIFYQLVADAFNVDINETNNLIQSVSDNFSNANIAQKLKMISKLYKNTCSDKTKNELNEAINKYKKTWPDLINTIKKLNPNSEIVVIEYYNPYHNIILPLIGNGSISFSQYVDSYVDELNEFLYDNENLGYDIAHIKDDFYKTDSTNVSVSLFDFNLDPHPNKKGHEIIYERIIDLLTNKIKENK